MTEGNLKNDTNVALGNHLDSLSMADKDIALSEDNPLKTYKDIPFHIQVFLWAFLITINIYNFTEVPILEDILPESDKYVALSEDISSDSNTDKSASNTSNKVKRIWGLYKDIFFVLVFFAVIFGLINWWITNKKDNKFIPSEQFQLPKTNISKISQRNKIKSLISTDEIYKKAEVITARIIISNNEEVYGGGGSGIIIKKSNLKSPTSKYKDKYYLLTVSHIWGNLPKDESRLKVILSDKKEYQAQICESQTALSVIGEYDLQIICFESEREYEVARISQDSELESWNDVYIFGYPCVKKDCSKGKFVRGNIGLTDLLPNSLTLNRGYSVPYTNETDRGMSGSPVLNFGGELIAIHGLGKNAESPISDETKSPYLLSDKTYLDSRNKEIAKYFSWGISLIKIRSLVEKLP